MPIEIIEIFTIHRPLIIILPVWRWLVIEQPFFASGCISAMHSDIGGLIVFWAFV
jgi:hypothetical protein